jgi:hypothetical protein
MPITAPPRYASPTVFFGGGGVNPPATSIGGTGSNPAGADSQGVLKTFSPENYGAIRGTTIDSTAAFQRTMDALVAAGGGVFFVAAGTWKADPPAIPANCIFSGAGMEATSIQAATVNGVIQGVDVSNVEVRDLTFVGLANNGAANTNRAIFFGSVAADIANITVRRVHVRQCKPIDAIIRIAGNGDLVTPATHFARRIRVEDCTITEYYDQDPSTIAVMSVGIYYFGGVKDSWIQRNYIDGTFGKHGIGAQSEANNIHIEDNIVLNCGITNAPNFGYGIFAYSSYTTVAVLDVFICRNTVINSARPGIYLAAVGKYTIAENLLDSCDLFSTGLGTFAGAIHINNSTDVAACGMGTVVGCTIIDPGFCAVYVNTGSFGRAKCTVTGNSCRVTTAVNRMGVVLWGRGCVISSNEFRGFSKGVFLYNTAANIIGDCTIADNEFDATGAAATIIGITANDVGFTINTLVIKGNRFIGCPTGLDIRCCTDIVLIGNTFAGCTGVCALLQGIVRGVLKGNMGDATVSAIGLQIALLAATATARVVIQGNLFKFCTTPLNLTENTGYAIISGNDFGAQPGVTANQGDASVAVVQPSPEIIWMGSTKTANRTVTFNLAQSYRGQKFRVLHDPPVPGAFTLAVVDQQTATTLYTLAASVRGWVDVEWDGFQYRFLGAGTFT